MKNLIHKEWLAIALVAGTVFVAAERRGFAQAAQHPHHGSLAATALPQMPRFRFENFTTANGLPNDHVFAVLVDGDRIWAGTDNGLALYENGKWKTYTTADGPWAGSAKWTTSSSRFSR